MGLGQAKTAILKMVHKTRLKAIKNIASQTLPSHSRSCKFGTFVREITLYPYFCAKEAYYLVQIHNYKFHLSLISACQNIKHQKIYLL